MKYYLFLLLTLSVVLCGCEKCEGPPNAHESSLRLFLRNGTGTQSLFLPPTSYSPDSVKVLNEQGIVVARSGFFPSSYPESAIAIPLLESGVVPALNRPVTRRYLLYLKRTDQDTIQVEYELFENDCKKPDFKNIIVFYNNQKVHEGNSVYIPDLLIRKP